MKNKSKEKKPQKFAVQWLLRVGFIWAIHIIAFFIGGLLLEINNIVEIIVGILLIVMIYTLIFFIAKNDGDKDYAVLSSNRKSFYNNYPLNARLMQFSYWKGFVISSIAMLPVIIMHIIVLCAKITALKGLVSFFYIGITLLFGGAGVYDSTAALSGGNFAAYAVLFSISIVLSLLAYPAGYIWGGRKRIIFHRQVQKEQSKKSRDW